MALFAFAASSAGAASVPAPDLAVEQLNAWRSIVGVAPVRHDPALDAGCRRHASYHRANPTHRGHREEPSAPGYSAAGDRAARTSVLSYGRDRERGPRVWEPGPYHRMALLHPRLTTTGFWSEFGLTCMAVSAVDAGVRTPALVAHTYPVNGQRAVPTTFGCNERPNPCAVVPGNDGRIPTGFNVSVQFNGPWASLKEVAVASATLTPVHGQPVPLTVQTAAPARRVGIVAIPHEPLALARTYVAAMTGTVTAAGDDGSAAKHPFALSWSFSTPGIEPAASLRVSLQRMTRAAIYLRVKLHSVDPRRARVTLLNGRTPLRRVIRQITSASQQVMVPRPRKRVTTINVLLRGSAKHAGVATRLPVDIPPPPRAAGATSSKRK